MKIRVLKVDSLKKQVTVRIYHSPTLVEMKVIPLQNLSFYEVIDFRGHVVKEVNA